MRTQASNAAPYDARGRRHMPHVTLRGEYNGKRENQRDDPAQREGKGTKQEEFIPEIADVCHLTPSPGTVHSWAICVSALQRETRPLLGH